MLQDHAAEYRQKAEECRLESLAARTVDGRAAWLAMAQEWMRLAEDAEAELANFQEALDEQASLLSP